MRSERTRRALWWDWWTGAWAGRPQQVVRCDCGRWRDGILPRWADDKVVIANGWLRDDQCPGCGDLLEAAS